MMALHCASDALDYHAGVLLQVTKSIHALLSNRKKDSLLKKSTWSASSDKCHELLL